jgi:two-component system, response regulator
MAKRLSVLLVDDDPDDAEMMLFSLNKISWCEFHYVGDGVDALSYLYSGDHAHPDIIILDLRMPRVDGVDVLRKLRVDPSKSHIPVIALISSKQGIQYLESYNVKPQGYLLKPVEVSDFLMVLAQLGLSAITVNKEISSQS